MSSSITHGVVAWALSRAAPDSVPHRRLILVLVFFSVIPDLDVIGYALGIPYEHPLGHRGFSHSLLFALICGFLTPGLTSVGKGRSSGTWWILVALGFLTTASHGLLDACTDGGRGIGFFIPFHNGRYFFPWRPIAAIPLSLSGIVSIVGAKILTKEILFIWAPTLVLMSLYLRLRTKGTK